MHSYFQSAPLLLKSILERIGQDHKVIAIHKHTRSGETAINRSPAGQFFRTSTAFKISVSLPPPTLYYHHQACYESFRLSLYLIHFSVYLSIWRLDGDNERQALAIVQVS